MRTRRQLLQQTLLVPLAMAARGNRVRATNEIICEADCLSQESARGFALVPAPLRPTIIVCAAGPNALSRASELRKRASDGAWIVWENAPQVRHSPDFAEHERTLRNFFGIQIEKVLLPDLYVEYLWPERRLTRSFGPVAALRSAGDALVIAHYGGTHVGVARRIGRGGIIFLGSMLGPNLYAEEPQAHAIAAGLFRSIAERYSGL